MTRTVHCIAGVATCVSLCIAHPGGFTLGNVHIIPHLAVVTSFVGSWMPDLDLKPNSWSRGKKGIVKSIARMQTKLVNNVTGGHRGIFHTLLFPVIFMILLTLVDKLSTLSNIKFIYVLLQYGTSLIQSLLFGLALGWIVHIIADMFNGKGAPLLWPISRSKISIMDLPSEGFGQYIFLVPYVILVMVLPNLSKIYSCFTRL